jgi:hypothetical protein
MSDLQSAVILALIFGAFSWIPGFQGLMFRLTQLAGVYVEPGNPMLIWVGFGFAIGIGGRFILDAYTTLMKLGSAGVRGVTEGFFSGGGGAQRSAVQSIVVFGVAISIVSLTSYISVYLQALEEYLLLVENTLAVVGDYLALTLAVVLVFIGVIAYRTGRLMRTVARKQVGAPQFLFGAFFFGLLQIIDLRVGIFALVIAFLAAGFSPSLALRIPLFFAIPASLMTGFSLIAGSGGSVLTEAVILVLIGVSALSTFVVLSFVFRFTEKLSLGSFSGLIGILILAVSSNIVLFGFSLAKIGYYALFGIGVVGASIFSFELFTEVSRRHKVKDITTEILNETKRSTEQARIIKAVEANKLTTSTGEIENIAEPMNFMVRQGKVERVNSVVKSVSEKELRRLQGEMGDPDPKKRKDVLQQLNDIMASLPDLTLKEFSAIKELEAALEVALADESEWVRYFAVDSYAHLFAAYGMILDTLPDWMTKTVEKLIPLLNDIDVDVRYITAKTIGVIGGIDAEKVSSAIPQLITLTGDANNDVRYVALEALKQIALPEVVSSGLPRVIEKFNDQDKEVRLAAIRAVGEFHKIAPNETDAAVEPLKELRDDSDKDIRTEASNCLAVISSEVARVTPESEITDAKAVIEKPVEKRATIRPTITHLLTNLKVQNTELGKMLKVVEQGDNMNYMVSISFKNVKRPLKKIKIVDEMPRSYEISKMLPPKQKSKVRKRDDRKDIEFTLKNLDVGQTFDVAYTIEGSEPYTSKPLRVELEGFIETGTTTDAMEKEKKKKYRLPAIHALLRKEYFSELSDTGS